MSAARTGTRRDQIGHRHLGDAHLAQSGQHAADVGEETAVRPHHEDPAPAHPLPVRVQQVGDPVQADSGLAGAGRALHAYSLVGVSPDDVVLVGLDRGHDVAHGTGSRPLDLLDQDPADLGGRVIRQAAGRRTTVRPA